MDNAYQCVGDSMNVEGSRRVAWASSLSSATRGSGWKGRGLGQKDSETDSCCILRVRSLFDDAFGLVCGRARRCSGGNAMELIGSWSGLEAEKSGLHLAPGCLRSARVDANQFPADCYRLGGISMPMAALGVPAY